MNKLDTAISLIEGRLNNFYEEKEESKVVARLAESYFLKVILNNLLGYKKDFEDDGK